MKSKFALGLLAGGLLIGAATIAVAQNTTSTPQPAAQNPAPPAAVQSSNGAATGYENPTYNGPLASQNGTTSETATTINPRTGAGAGHPGEGGFVRLFGCLERGSGANEYSLMGQGANWWELKSTSIDLGAYLDQTVMIAALPTPNPDGTLNVAALAMVQNSCASW